jgi:hypothetical protein
MRRTPIKKPLELPRFGKDAVTINGVMQAFACLVGACLLAFGVPAQANPNAPLLDNTPVKRTLAVSDYDSVAGLSAIEADIDITQSEIQITEVYIGLQGRAPDPGGLAYWVNQLDSAIAAGQARSLALKKLTNDITLSEEWYSGIGANDGLTQSGAEAIVRAMYLNLFDRPATASDVAYWSADLTTGRVTESEMVVLLILGAQSKGNADSQVLEFKRQAASYYSSNITSASFMRESATEAVAGVTDEQSLLASVDFTDQQSLLESAACGSTAKACYISDVEPVVQQRCVVCHQQGLTADQQGARLLFTDDAATNHAALETFVTTDGVGADWLLGKIVGDLGHGGGPVLVQGSNSYFAFADYLTLLVGANTGGGSVEASSIWSGTVMENPETTLRRAGILLAGKVPSAAAIRRVQSLKHGLKSELIALMEGEGFHDFLTTGANDRLLTNGLNNGIDFQFNTWRFPTFQQFERSLPEDRPEEFNTEEYWDRPFLDRGSANGEFRQALIREPLELIAYIVENDRSYKEVVTADYTMVNQFSAMAYRADVAFDEPMYDDDGFYDRSRLNTFKPAKNSGHIPSTNDNVVDEDAGIYSIAEYHDWPHAGVLSTPAWLNRYPSTDTNRNRARARWTYYQFLGVDIEKSAPRTTDPVALADTNNPTMNNPACTVCHERMDPVAGAYQSFGDGGNYLDQWGGLDSLPDGYKRPQTAAGDLHQLEHLVPKEDTQVHQISKAVTTREGGTFTVSNPDPCIQDEQNSTDEEWVGWCTNLAVADITVYADGSEVLKLKASEFDRYLGFTISTGADSETGEQYNHGNLNWNGDLYNLWNYSWMAFELPLDEGDYEVVVTLATSQQEGYPEDFVVAGLRWAEGLTSADTYQYGDTWYRDMRSPGFNGQAATNDKDSLQWLGQKIAEDPRFSEATVKFWWPSVFGSEVLVAPVDRSLPDYEAQLLAFNAQEALVEELATAFAAGGFKVKSLLADMMLSPWFRTTAIVGSLSETQETVLETVGRGRQLTPEELDRKNRAVFGRTWGQRSGDQAHEYRPQTNFTGRGSYAAFYGGIDGASITKRNREQTPLMSNVIERMAIDLACQAVVDDFSKPREQRIIFTEIPRASAADLLLDDSFELLGQVPVTDQWPGNWMDHPVVSGVVTLVGGQTALRIADVTRDSYGSIDGEPSNADLIIQQIILRRISSGETLVIDGVNLPEMTDVVFDTYIDHQGQERLRGDVIDAPGGFWLHENAWVELLLNLPAGEYEIDLTLATSLTENHVNEAMTVGVTALAIDSGGDTTTSQQIRRQMTQLLHNATTRKPSEAEIDTLVEALTNHADLAKGWGSDFNNVEGGCDNWQIWPDQQPSAGKQQLRFEDGDGMMRAWTMILHSLMTSYLYLHD